MKDYVVVAYWIGEPWRRAALKLAASLDALSIPHEIHARPEQGSWWANMRYKALFVREMMAAHPDRPLLLLDADSEVRRPPDLLASVTEDVAVMLWTEPDGKTCAYDATLYVRPTERARAMVARWAERDRIEHRPPPYSAGMEPALAGTPGLSVRPLPPEYCWIEPQMRARFPGAEPVIVQEAMTSLTSAPGR